MSYSVLNTKLYHAKTGGDITGSTFIGPTFFALQARHASVYAEYCAYNDGHEPDEAGIVVYPVLVTIERPAVTHRPLLKKIGKLHGVTPEKLSRFADDFEDGNAIERDIVFSWLKQHGHDGAIIPKDLMPACAGGDWRFQQSYVAFEPEHQVRFILSA